MCSWTSLGWSSPVTETVNHCFLKVNVILVVVVVVVVLLLLTAV